MLPLWLLAGLALAAPPDVVMGEYVVARAADHPEVRTYGVGPCLALSLYDPAARVGALAHVAPSDEVRPSVDAMLRALLGAGADPRRVVARVVGGWRKSDDPGLAGFEFTSGEMLGEVKAALGRYGIPLDDSGALAVLDLRRPGGAAVRALRLDLRTGAFEDAPLPPGGVAPRSLGRDGMSKTPMQPHPASLDAPRR